MIKFRIGKTYYCTSITDPTCTFRFECLDRSKQFVKLKYSNGATIRKKIVEFDYAEHISPFGVFDFSPLLSAANTTEDSPRVNDLIMRIDDMQAIGETSKNKKQLHIFKSEDRDLFEPTILKALGFTKKEDETLDVFDWAWYERTKNNVFIKITTA